MYQLHIWVYSLFAPRTTVSSPNLLPQPPGRSALGSGGGRGGGGGALNHDQVHLHIRRRHEGFTMEPTAGQVRFSMVFLQLLYIVRLHGWASLDRFFTVQAWLLDQLLEVLLLPDADVGLQFVRHLLLVAKDRGF